MATLRTAGIDQVSHVITTNRQMMEKALLMRGQSYLADVKAQLLTNMIYEIDSSRKKLLTAHQRLQRSMASVTSQKDTLAKEVEQRWKAEQTAHRARLQAEAANRARAQFLVNISHDVLTPLNAIKAYAEMISDEILGPCEPEGYKDYGNDIRVASDHLHTLVEALLETTRTETGQLRVAAQDVDLADLLQETRTLVAHLADQKNITLSVTTAISSAPISADPVLIRRLMLNLTTNAVKYTDPGGRIDLSVELDLDGGAVLSFANTGQGIAAEDIDTALTPYGRVDATPDGPSGFGLGLPMAKAIAEAHGGSLNIESEVGTGTTMTVRLPQTPPPD